MKAIGTFQGKTENEGEALGIDVRMWASKTQPYLAGLFPYLAEAYVVVALLMAVHSCAPLLPPLAFPFVFLAYALLATVGSMFNVVTNRLHKQSLYKEGGRLSRYNGKWSMWFGGIFVAYYVSALFFVLQSPSWDAQEWLLIWTGPFVYYLIFFVVGAFSKKEFSPKYYKARAIKWSIIIAALASTLLYAALSAQPPTDLQIDLHEIIDNRPLHLADAASPLLAELEKLTSYANCLTQYGINKLTNASYAISFIVNMVLGFSVFTGVFSLFGACLLQPQEIKSVLQALPANNDTQEGRIRPCYLIVLAIAWVVLSFLFVSFDNFAKEARATSEYTILDTWIQDTSGWIILAAENDLNEIKEAASQAEKAQAYNEEFKQRKEDFVSQQTPRVIAQVNAYYDSCIAKVESYCEWSASIPANAVRFIPVIGENVVKDEFDKQVVNPVSSETLRDEYSTLLDGLTQLYQEYWNADETRSSAPLAQILSADEIIAAKNIPDQPALWPAWDSEEGKAFVQDALMNGSGKEPQELRDEIISYIEKQRATTLAYVEKLPTFFFPTMS